MAWSLLFLCLLLVRGTQMYLSICQAATQLQWSAFVFFGLCVHFRALKRLFARIVRLCGTRSDYRRWAVLIANAAQLRLFRSTWVDGYAVPKENNVLRWLLLFVAGTDQCSHYFRIRRQSKLWRQSARSRTCIQGFDGEHFYRLT